MIPIEERNGSAVFHVRVQPRAGRDEIAGEFQGALKIRLTAPPLENRANQALREFLAGQLNVSVSAVKILSGRKSRTKRVEVQGITAAQIHSLA